MIGTTTPIHDPPHVRDQILVTGASSGIGLAVTRRLLHAGTRVVGVDIAPAATELATSPHYHHLQADLLQAAALRQVIAQLLSMDFVGVVHSAGIMRADSTARDHVTPGQELWQLHVATPWQLIRELAPQLPDGRGRIVILSSRAAQGRAGRGLYAASKAGAEALVRSFALELLHRGITVNAVAPGAVDTPQLRDPARKSAPVAVPPMGRLIQPQEIAASVVFLLAAEAGSITGQTLRQCGGRSLATAAPHPWPAPATTDISP